MTTQPNETDNNNDEQVLSERVTAFCERSGYYLSPQANSILRDIVHVKLLTGDFYCPCQTQRIPETICVCQSVRNGLVDIMGTCFCNLILSKNIEMEEVMSEIAKVMTAQRYAQGFTYEAYLNSIGENRNRFTPHITAFKLAPVDAQFFKSIVHRVGAVKIVAIGEDWCPDVHRGLPIIAKVAEASGMELRFFPRDKNLDIMNLFLKDGKYQSIPVFAFFDGNFNHLCHWIERPTSAYRFQEQIRAELMQQKLSEDDTRKAMREKMTPLADSWRQDTVAEIKTLLSEVTQK